MSLERPRHQPKPRPSLSQRACALPALGEPLGHPISHYQGNEAQTPGLGGGHHYQIHAKKELEKSRPAPRKLSARHHRYRLCCRKRVEPAAWHLQLPPGRTRQDTRRKCLRRHLAKGGAEMVGEGGIWEGMHVGSPRCGRGGGAWECSATSRGRRC